MGARFGDNEPYSMTFLPVSQTKLTGYDLGTNRSVEIRIEQRINGEISQLKIGTNETYPVKKID